MGFSTTLQGQSSHEALLGRQDAEIKLLETMRRCLTTKVKSDREYASAISSLTVQGKKVERYDDLVGSLIAQVFTQTKNSVFTIISYSILCLSILKKSFPCRFGPQKISFHFHSIFPIFFSQKKTLNRLSGPYKKFLSGSHSENYFFEGNLVP